MKTKLLSTEFLRLSTLLIVTLLTTLLLVPAASATVTNVVIDGGKVSVDVYKNSPFQVPVQVTYQNETNLKVKGSGVGITFVSSSELMVSTSGSATFSCKISNTGTYSFTAESGSNTDTIQYNVIEMPSWSATLSNVSYATTEDVTLTIDSAATLEGVMVNVTKPSGWNLSAGPSLGYSIGDITAVKKVTWTFTRGGSGELNDLSAVVTVTNPVDSKTASFSSGSSSTAGEEIVMITLQPGWNLISLPVAIDGLGGLGSSGSGLMRAVVPDTTEGIIIAPEEIHASYRPSYVPKPKNTAEGDGNSRDDNPENSDDGIIGGIITFISDKISGIF